jgi:hypothetical protein
MPAIFQPVPSIFVRRLTPCSRLAFFTVVLLVALPLTLCAHRLILKRRNLHSLFKRPDLNMPSMRATGSKSSEYSVLPLFDPTGVTSPKAEHQA